MMKWVSFPVREEPVKGFLVGLFIISLSFLIGIIWSMIFGLLSLLLLWLSLLPFFTPTYYIIDEDGVVVKKIFYTIKKQWQDFHSFYPDKFGVLLSPFSKPTPLENYRGTYLRFNNNRDEVLEFIKKKISS